MLHNYIVTVLALVLTSTLGTVDTGQLLNKPYLTVKKPDLTPGKIKINFNLPKDMKINTRGNSISKITIADSNNEDRYRTSFEIEKKSVAIKVELPVDKFSSTVEGEIYYCGIKPGSRCYITPFKQTDTFQRTKKELSGDEFKYQQQVSIEKPKI